MKLNSISIQNFRCFKDLKINFNPQMNVIIGNNGVGKTAILDALAVGIGSFFSGNNAKATEIKREDVRYSTIVLGSTIDRQPQYPVVVKCIGELDGKNPIWERELCFQNDNSPIKNLVMQTSYAGSLEDRVKQSDENVCLPLISYYGTGRLWAQKSNELEKISLTDRFQGYKDCLSAESNEKFMLAWFEKMTYIELQEGNDIPELRAVIGAVEKCFIESGTEVSDVKVQFSVKSEQLEITYKDKNGNTEKHPFHELSAGYRNMLCLVADIAYRMAMLNPQLLDEVTKKTEGIVLIDEIDLHLHPIWQKKILKTLRSIFPCVQFIVTTHAPSVISSVRREELLILNDEHCEPFNYEVYGKDVNSVLSEIMGTSERPDEITQMFNMFHTLLDNEQYEEAKAKLDKLRDLLGENDNEVISSSISLNFKKEWSE